MQVQPSSFLTSELGGGEWLISCPGCLNFRKEPQYTLKRGLGGPPRVSLPVLEKTDVNRSQWKSNPESCSPQPSRYSMQFLLPATRTMNLLYCLLKVKNCGTSSLQPQAVNGRNMENQPAKLGPWPSRLQPHVHCPYNICLQDSKSGTPQKCW